MQFPTACDVLQYRLARLADDVQSTSEVSNPVVTEGNHILLAEDTESASEVSSPAVGQVHVLLAEDIESQSEVSTPSIDAVVDDDIFFFGPDEHDLQDDDRVIFAVIKEFIKKVA